MAAWRQAPETRTESEILSVLFQCVKLVQKCLDRGKHFPRDRNLILLENGSILGLLVLQIYNQQPPQCQQIILEDSAKKGFSFIYHKPRPGFHYMLQKILLETGSVNICDKGGALAVISVGVALKRRKVTKKMTKSQL